MKYLTICFSVLVFFVNVSFATNYFFSTIGDDITNSGLTTASPYRTISKLNSLSLQPGDSIFFKCNEIFRGQITISISGNSTNKIVFTSYGTGNKPVISGAEIITGFTLNGSKYEKTLTQKINNFFVSDREQTLARFPNNGRYLTLDSAQTTYLKDVDLLSLPANYLNESSICVHTAQWCWEKSPISNFDNIDKITYSSPTFLAAIAKYSYFLYDNINLLDTANEWKFDSTSFLLSYMGANPNAASCEGSTYFNGISFIGNASYVVVNNLHFEKQMNAGVAIASSSNKYIQVTNCYFARQYNYGVHDKGRNNEVSYCYFREVDGIGIFSQGSGAGKHISHHNVMRNIGPFRNSGIGTEINLNAIKFGFTDSCIAQNNDIDSVGYCGISADGAYHLVEKNIIKNAMLLNNDGAALKSFGTPSHHNIFRNNFVSLSDGNTEGTFNANFITPAIYFDFNVKNSTIQDNTVYGRTQKGIFQNAGNVSNTIIGNTIYGANYGLDLNGHSKENTADTINGYLVKKNIFWAKNSNDFIMRQVDFTNAYTFGLFDSNYYFQPYSTKFIIRTAVNPPTFSFTSWQGAGNDLNSKVNSFSWATGVDSSQIFLNPTDNIVTQSLGGWVWRDLDGNIVNSLSLQPWTSKILIRTSIALTLNLVSFNANLNSTKVDCKWITANETNTSHFNVQRSEDGITFDVIARVNALNNINNEYNFSDNFLPVSPTLFYRLQIVDIDAKVSYSSIQKIEVNYLAEKILIYPNPATNYLFIKANDIASYTIVNALGKRIKVETLSNLNLLQTININDLVMGNYWIKLIKINGEIKTLPFKKL